MTDIKPIGEILQKHTCATLGCENETLPPLSFCPNCCEQIEALENSERQREAAERIRRRIERRIEHPRTTILRMGVPLAMRDFTFANMKSWYPSSKCIDGVKDALKAGRGVLLIGAIGCGKTHLAVASLFDAACQNAKSLEIYGFIDCARYIYYIDNLDKRERDAALETIVKKEYLIIDDLGWEGNKYIDIIRIIIRERYNLGKINIITTNLGISKERNQLSERYALDIWSRIKSTCRLISVGGGDNREVKK